MTSQHRAAIEFLAARGYGSEEELAQEYDDVELYQWLYELGYDWDGFDWEPAQYEEPWEL